MKLLPIVIFLITFAAYAQAVPQEFVETVPPKGIIRGFLQVGGQYGALVAGGDTVYSNDIFAVISRGNTVQWKVLELTADKKRFARDVLNDNPHATPDNISPNFGDLVMILENDAKKYKAASTKVLKEEELKVTCEDAANWCSNNVLCVKGELAEISMESSAFATIRLKNVDTGPFAKMRIYNLFVDTSYQLEIPIAREKALMVKAGDTVIICGKPVFYPGSLKFIADAIRGKKTFTQFRMLGDIAMIGSLDIEDLKFDIFDSRNESVK